MTPADVILQKALAASSIPSSQWERIRADLRNRAFFSARVESARFLYEARQAAHDAVGHALRADGAGYTEADAVERIREAARTLAGELKNVGKGGLLDPSSFQRARLIVETNASLAAGYIRHVADIQPGALAAFPAKELFRPAYSRPQTPRNWLARWQQAGGKIYSGRMIALATDPVWSKISRFGNPYPPFDFNSGMETRAVSRSECIALGVMAKDAPQPSPPPATSFNAGLQAEVDRSFLDSSEWANLKNACGDFIQYERTGDKLSIKWRGERIKEAVDGNNVKISFGKISKEALSKTPQNLAKRMENKSVSFSGTWMREHGGKHLGANETDPRNIPLTKEEYELVPVVWRSPDRVDAGDANAAIFELDTLDGTGVYRLVVDTMQNFIVSFYKIKKGQR